MTKGLRASAAEDVFKNAQASHLDVIYGTSNGIFWFDLKDAKDAITLLDDKNITQYYRNSIVRHLANRDQVLRKMVVATDYIKLKKHQKQMPEYPGYLTYSKEQNTENIDEPIFNFIRLKVFTSKRPNTIGIRDEIFMFDRGVVMAYFLRRYVGVIIWQVADNIVCTSPTHIELSRKVYCDIFSDFVAESECVAYQPKTEKATVT